MEIIQTSKYSRSEAGNGVTVRGNGGMEEMLLTAQSFAERLRAASVPFFSDGARFNPLLCWLLGITVTNPLPSHYHSSAVIASSGQTVGLTALICRLSRVNVAE